eukprot:360600-Chlamydomonas_euryale.AAC.2
MLCNNPFLVQNRRCRSYCVRKGQCSSNRSSVKGEEDVGVVEFGKASVAGTGTGTVGEGTAIGVRPQG